jgi:hypothetical protein
VGIHPNVGITFDLRECRSLSARRIQGFEARVVNLDLAEETRTVNKVVAPLRTADFWVFVDGELKYSRRRFGRDWKGEPLRVELGSEDRFLTLVSTDGGDETPFDHVMLVDPVLTMSGPTVPARNGTRTD